MATAHKKISLREKKNVPYTLLEEFTRFDEMALTLRTSKTLALPLKTLDDCYIYLDCTLNTVASRCLHHDS